MKYYIYTGTLSQIGGPDNHIILHDIQDDNKPPVMLSCYNKALHKYLGDRSWTDDEEKYINQSWIFNSCLDLVAISIPSANKDRPGPAKIVAVADPDRVWIDELLIIGPEELINTASPDTLPWEDIRRWNEYRAQHRIYFTS